MQITNAGIAGDTTSGMLTRLSGVIAKDTRVVILQPGGNDARRGEGGATQSNIAEIRRRLSQQNISVVILDQLGKIAPQHRLPDGQHFSAAGHAAFAANLAPRVTAAGACKR